MQSFSIYRSTGSSFSTCTAIGGQGRQQGRFNHTRQSFPVYRSIYRVVVPHVHCGRRAGVSITQGNRFLSTYRSIYRVVVPHVHCDRWAGTAGGFNHRMQSFPIDRSIYRSVRSSFDPRALRQWGRSVRQFESHNAIIF